MDRLRQDTKKTSELADVPHSVTGIDHGSTSLVSRAYNDTAIDTPCPIGESAHTFSLKQSDIARIAVHDVIACVTVRLSVYNASNDTHTTFTANNLFGAVIRHLSALEKDGFWSKAHLVAALTQPNPDERRVCLMIEQSMFDILEFAHVPAHESTIRTDEPFFIQDARGRQYAEVLALASNEQVKGVMDRLVAHFAWQKDDTYRQLLAMARLGSKSEKCAIVSRFHEVWYSMIAHSEVHAVVKEFLWKATGHIFGD